jgi:hypothetical protein
MQKMVVHNAVKEETIVRVVDSKSAELLGVIGVIGSTSWFAAGNS